MTETTYIAADALDVPQGLTWATPGRMQGQIVEVQYGAFAVDPGYGDPWERVCDRSATSEWTYYRAVQP